MPITNQGKGRAVLVTGCSSGIGRATAVQLADAEYTVFATVRKESDCRELASLGKPGLVPLFPLDLRMVEHIPPLVQRINEELTSRGLAGLSAIVNVAGGGGFAPLELVDIEEFRGELETRLVGPVALAQALLPSLRLGKGRLIWIATPALIPIPFVSSIHACDFAANCITRTFALELRPWGIPSIFVRCGGVRTPSVDRSYHELDDVIAGWLPEKRGLYADALERNKKQLAVFDAKRSEPSVVAEKVLEAVRAPKPKRVYRAGYLVGASAILDMLPQPLVDWIMARR
jgi:NAD(P)-dependent dehydrogenase (short-subunit alcohol dehydrogenase family)